MHIYKTYLSVTCACTCTYTATQTHTHTDAEQSYVRCTYRQINSNSHPQVLRNIRFFQKKRQHPVIYKYINAQDEYAGLLWSAHLDFRHPNQ